MIVQSEDDLIECLENLIALCKKNQDDLGHAERFFYPGEWLLAFEEIWFGIAKGQISTSPQIQEHVDAIKEYFESAGWKPGN